MPITEPQFHLKTSVQLHAGWSVDVSTAELRYSGGYETCLFFMREGKEQMSEVVALYSYRSEAELAHAGFTNPAVLRSILSLLRGREFLINEIRGE